MKGRCLLLYGDIIFETSVLEKLLKSPADITLVVDLAWYEQQQHGVVPSHINPDLVSLQDPPGKSYLFRYVMPDEQNRVVAIGRHLAHDRVHGEFIGMAMFSEKGMEAFKQTYREALQQYESKGFHEAATVNRA